MVVKPYGAGHYLNGFSLVSNSFRVFNATIDRVEMVDTSLASLDMAQARNVRVEGNSFNNVGQGIMNPLIVTHTQNTPADTWTVGSDGFVPFGGRIRMVESVQAEGAILNGSNAARYAFPNATPGVGAQGNQAQLRWGEAVRGTAIVRMRMDLPS